MTNKINVAELREIAQLFAESKMFSDAASAAQCFVKVLAGAEMNIPPFTSMNAFHIIQGKVTLAAGTIAARIKASGRYDYRVKEKSSERCAIEFTDRATLVHTEIWDMTRARKAGVKNLDKFPDAMLFSRCISAGARVACPDVIGAYYTPEELGADTNADGEVVPVTQIGAPQEAPQIAAPAKPVAALADAAWKLELTTLGKRAASVLKDVTDLPANQRAALEAAIQYARDTLAANGNSTTTERVNAVEGLKVALGIQA